MHIRMLLTIAQLSEVVKSRTIFLLLREALTAAWENAILGGEEAPEDKAGAGVADTEAAPAGKVDVGAGKADTAEVPGRVETEVWAVDDADAAGTTTRSMEFFLALISPSFLQNMRKGKRMVPRIKRNEIEWGERAGLRIK